MAGCVARVRAISSERPSVLAPEESKLRVESKLKKGRLEVDTSRVSVLHEGPPVLYVEDFLDKEVCDNLVECASASKYMKASSVGGSMGAAERTSSTLPITRVRFSHYDFSFWLWNQWSIA